MHQNTNKQYFTLNRNQRQPNRDGPFSIRKDQIENQLFSLYIVETNINIQGMLRKLHATYIHEKIPDFYAYFFLAQLAACSQQRIVDSVNRQMQLLKTKQCHFNFIQRTINARESCIKSLNGCLESVFQQNDRSSILKFGEEIQHLRQLTALVIEQIKQWKQYLLEISPQAYGDQHIAYYYQNNDYLLKMLNDIDFITQSFLATKVTFSHKQDPFLMRPFAQNQDERDLYAQIFRYRPQEQQHFVSCLEFLAGERADHLQRKVKIKQQKIREIERAYQTKQLVNRILLTKPTPNLFKKQKQQTQQAQLDFVDELKFAQKVRQIRRAQNYTNDFRQNKLKELAIKGEKIQKIRNMEIGNASPLINPKKFASSQKLQPNTIMQRSISLGFLNKSVNRPIKEQQKNDNETDFQTILRKKELQVLQVNNIRRRSYSSIRLKDRLSERKLVNDKEGAEQLQKILNQLQHLAPQQQENFLIRKQPAHKQQKKLLQHNQQALLGLRNNILKQIGDYTVQQQKVEEQKRLENDQLQSLIKKKLQQTTLQNLQHQKAQWTLGKDVLAHQLGKKSIFGLQDPLMKKSQKLTELQEDLKKQMQLKWMREVQQELIHRQNLFKRQKEMKKEQSERERELKIAIGKKEKQEKFQQIQKEERLKAYEAQIRKQQMRKRQIQLQMQEVVERQKQKLQSFSGQQKQKLQIEMRQAAKSKLLSKLRRQNSLFTSEMRARQQKQQKQQALRSQAKQRLEQQYQIQKHLEKQREREQKNKKLRLVALQMQHIEHQLSQNNLKRQQSIQKQQLQVMKSSLGQIPDFRQSKISPVREESKRKMRQEFELQLFAFNRPKQEIIEKQNVLIKDYKNKIDNQENLQGRIKQLQMELNEPKKQQKTQKLDNSKSNQVDPLFIRNTSMQVQSETSQKFARFSESQQNQKSQIKQSTINESDLKKLGIDMTPQEYMIYIKKKAIINAKRINPVGQDQEKARMKKILGEFQMMQNIQQAQPQSQSGKLDIYYSSVVRKPNQTIKQEQVQKKETTKKQRKIQIKKVKDSQDLSQVMKLTVHSKMTSSIKKKKFVTSDDSDNEAPKKKAKKKQAKQESQSSQNEEFLRKEKQNERQRELPKIQEVQLKTVSSQDLQTYLLDHFKKLPKIVRKLALFKKDQLLKTILQQQSVIILEVHNREEVQGICIVSQNENKQTLRSLNILHMGTYQASKMINTLIKSRDHLFSVDSCSQITFSLYFNKEDQQENKFIKQFEKQFDPYGAIFQKKINNQQAQRKHIMRRMIGEQSANIQKSKNVGQLKLVQHLLTHSVQSDLGLDLGLQDCTESLGGWTFLSLFLSKYGEQQQIKDYLAADVKEQNKNVKYLSKSAIKLKQNSVKDVQFYEFSNPFEANLKLIEQGVEILKCNPKIQQTNLPIKWNKLNIAIQPNLPFTSNIKTFHYKKDQFTSKYLRYKCGKGAKVVKLKSQLYSNQLTVLPCKPSNYKLVFTEANQFDLLKNTSLDLYMKLLLANIVSHVASSDEFIWVPQFQSNLTKKIKISEQFAFKSQLRSKVDLSFTEYVDNCISFKPTHRDLFITPPFIVAVLNSDVERLSQNSPIYIERIDLNNLLGRKLVPRPQAESDY